MKNTSDIVNALGARLGELGDRPAAPASASDAIKDRSEAADGGGKFRVGDAVVLKGLSVADLNGQVGKVIRAAGPVQPGRLPVELVGSARKILVKVENLELSTSPILLASQPQELAGKDGSANTSGRGDTSEDPPRDTKPAWPFSHEKMAAARDTETKVKEELWSKFLPGDDKPVGGDGLPPPELYYGR